MLIWAALLALATLLGADAPAPTPNPSQPPVGEPREIRSNANHSTGPASLAATPAAAVAAVSEAREIPHQDAPENAPLGLSFEGWIAVFTGILTIATIWLVLTTRQLWRSAQTADRPVIGIGIFQEPQIGNWQFDSSSEMPDTSRPSVSFFFKNYGKTPALIREIRANLEFLREAPKKLTYPHKAYLAHDEHVIAAGAESAVGRKIPMVEAFKKHGDVLAVAEGHMRLYFHGRVIYGDVFGKSHEHQWCWAFYGPPPYAFHPDYEGNKHNRST